MSAEHIHIAMDPPGHWHFSDSKTLRFTVKDHPGRPVAGLKASVTVTTLGGRVDRLNAEDQGDGTYTAEYTAWEIGSEYSTGYAVTFAASYQDERYADAWPVEVVRDGREDIVKDDRYLYHVRYGWHPGRPAASDDGAVDFYFEPRRALPEGDALDRRQPWRNPTDHLPGLNATILVRSRDGAVREELPARYLGLGVYHAPRVFTAAEVGDGRLYEVCLLFADPYNDQRIGVEDNAYLLEVLGRDSAAP